MKGKRQLITTLSFPRFERYYAACSNDADLAFKLYRKNQIISERMFVPIQNLEVALRNALHSSIAPVWGENWFDHPKIGLTSWQLGKVSSAKDDLLRQSKSIEPNRLIAELTFSFWTSMFSGHLEHALWHKGLLNVVFPFAVTPIQRREVLQDLEAVRNFRNRVFHHEPVFRAAAVTDIHDKILKYIEWINPEYRQWHNKHDGFLAIKGKLGPVYP
ncbi:hypothetical protein [Geothrix sp. SG200]|uniref:hypothetical protein n=1 Tax=Geothrix sp. SG200 TaxID=2922865 RepID=UPI001FAD9A51|nr:hypothetical protein [Geothrix sp. SG200]